jgi:uncharacterized protein (DUF2141 family)
MAEAPVLFRFPLLSLLLLNAAHDERPPPTAPVTVVVTQVRSSEGQVRVEICTEREFLKPCRYDVTVPARAGTTIAVVPGVPAGRYAALAYHDRNANGKADRNLIGLPTEDVGFSNGALKGLVKPKFSDAAFDHGPAAQRITFALRKF